MSLDSPLAARLCAPVLLALAVCCAPAQAQGSMTTPGLASATIILPISAAPVADLDFGAVGGIAEAPGAVTVSPMREGASYAGAARAVCGLSASCPRPHPARFAVSGEAGRLYRIALPASVMARADVPGVASLEVTGLSAQSASQPDTTDRGRLDVRGRDSITVGGTLVLPHRTAPAHYRAQFGIFVTYD